MISLQHVHPVLVHFPIVFFLTLAAFDMVAAFRGKAVTGRSSAANASTGLALLAGLSAIVTYFFGDLALTIAEDGGFSSEIAEILTREGVINQPGLFEAYALLNRRRGQLNRR